MTLPMHIFAAWLNSNKKSYGCKIDKNRVSDVQEIGGYGVVAVVDGNEVLAGNHKLMEKYGISYEKLSCYG